MKKISAVLLAALTALLSSVCFAEATVEGLVPSDEKTPCVSSAAYLNGKLYYFDMQDSKPILYAYDLGDGKSEALGELESWEPAGNLFAWGERLCSLQMDSGVWYSLLDENGRLAATKQSFSLDVSAMTYSEGDFSYALELTSLFGMGDRLYFAGVSYGAETGTVSGEIDLTTGAARLFDLPKLACLFPYNETRLGAYLYDRSLLYSGQLEDVRDIACECALFDPATGELSAPVTIQPDNSSGAPGLSGFCSDGERIYYMDGSRIMGLSTASGESKIAAYTGEGMYGGSGGGMTFCADGYYLSASYDGVSVYLLNSPSLEKGALRIFGESGSDTHRAFAKAHPEIAVEVSGDYSSDLEAITQAMVSDTNPYDVLLLSLNYMPVDQLMRKGYCADLSGNEALMELSRSMYPQFGEIMLQDGKLYGLPVSASAYSYSVNTTIWETLGLSEEELPKTLYQLLDFAANWAFDYGDDYPEYYLFSYTSAESFFSMILNDYMAYILKKEGVLRFNTPEFNRLLQVYETVDFKELASLHDENEAIWSERVLFETYSSILPLNYSSYLSEGVEPLLLSVADGEDPVIPVSTTVMIVNPKSSRMEDAMTYMEYYVTHLPREEGTITFFPSGGEPVESSYYQRDKAEIQELLDDAKKRLDAADEENKASVREEVSNWEEQMEWVESHRYSVTAEQLARYRQELLPLLYIQRQNVLFSSGEQAQTEISSLIRQYLEKAIDRERFLRELEGRIRLMQLEDQI